MITVSEQVMFSVGMLCDALTRELLKIEKVCWCPDHAVMTQVGRDGTREVMVPCGEGTILNIDVTLAEHNEHWFPVTVIVTRNDSTKQEGFIVQNSCNDGSIVGFLPFNTSEGFDRFDLGQSMVCPHPPAICIE